MTIRSKLLVILLLMSVLFVTGAGAFFYTGLRPVTKHINAISKDVSSLQSELSSSMEGLKEVLAEQNQSAARNLSSEYIGQIQAHLEWQKKRIRKFVANKAKRHIPLLFENDSLIGFKSGREGAFTLENAGRQDRAAAVQRAFSTPKIDHPVSFAWAENDTPIMEVVCPFGQEESLVVYMHATKWVQGALHVSPERDEGFILTDKQGRIIFSRDLAQVGKNISGALPSQKEYYIVRKGLLDGVFFGYTFMPKTSLLASVGIFDSISKSIKTRADRAFEYLDFVISGLNSMSQNLLALTLAFVMLNIVGAIFYSRKLSRPIELLAAQANEIGRGNLEVRTAPSRDATVEITRLSDSFERMRLALKGQIENLDSLVFERTQQLEMANLHLKKAIQDADKANLAKSQFLTLMSHEIRTPLNAIIGYADVLWDSQLSQRQRHCVAAFRASGGVLLNVINDILDFSKIEAGQIPLENIEFNIRDLVEDVARIVGPQAFEKGLELNHRIAPGAPILVEGDPYRTKQVLLNLAGNAVKFTEQGSVSIMAYPYAPPNSEEKIPEGQVQILFQVIDTGKGVPVEKMAHVFQAFTQAEADVTRKHGGSGLGLTISKQLVELMGGVIAVENRSSGGAIFSCRLPYQLKRSDDPKEAMNLADVRLLIAVASDLQRQELLDFAKTWKAECMAVRAPDELEILLKHNERFDVVIMEANFHQHSQDLKGKREGRADDWKSLNSWWESALPNTPGILLVESAQSYSWEESAGDLNDELFTFCIKPIKKRCIARNIKKSLALPPLPMDVEEDAPPSSHEPAPPASRKILLVEDNEHNRVLISFYLEGYPVHIDYAANGREAVDMAAVHDYDVILMDLEMPVMGGLEATTLIREIEKNESRPASRVIALTAHAFTEHKEKCLASGCDEFLTKPITKQDFLKAVLKE